MKDNLRPGVYARCEREAHTSGEGGRTAAIFIACADNSQPGSFMITEFPGGEENLTPRENAAARLLIKCGADKVRLVRYEEGENPFDSLKEEISAAVCDGAVPPKFMTQWLSSQSQGGRPGFVLTGRDTAEEAAESAREISSGRAIVCGPGVSLDGSSGYDPLYASCAMAGRITASQNPLTRFSGMEFPELKSAGPLPEEEIQALLRAGVCVFEETCGAVRLIRGLTCSPDPDTRDIGIGLGADYVLARVKSCLEKRLRDGVTSPQSIKDQAIVELMAMAEEGILRDFDPPRCAASPKDPSACTVTLSFVLSRPISRIYITARIRV